MLDKNNKLEDCIKTIITLTKQTLKKLFDTEEHESNEKELMSLFQSNRNFIKAKSSYFPDIIKRDEL